MKVNGKNYETIWLKPEDERIVQIIDQQFLPFKFVIADLCSVDDVSEAIRSMSVRGAPLIGAAGAFGVYLATIQTTSDHELIKAADLLKSSRPTAVNLSYAVDRALNEIVPEKSREGKMRAAKSFALKLCEEEKEYCRMIGEFGLPVIKEISMRKKEAVVNILTHCNAGWLASIDYGTALAPVYLAHDNGIKVHVWVDETRPRNQGSRLTAWELLQHGVPHTIIADNCGGHLMQRGLVDMVIVGSDRTTTNGDVANKTGTYLKALAAFHNNIPFYAAFPSSSIDWNINDGIPEIPIEQRDSGELKYIEGCKNGKIEKVLIAPEQSQALNYAFDVTPSQFITALITERGICKPDKHGILNLFRERIKNEG
jgi:methylthioribose-1-phosphate isomerase